MTETVYEKKEQKEMRANLVFRLPKNRKQIGQPGEASPEIFVEDYAWMYGKRLSERDYTGCVAGVLLGETVELESGKKVMIRGIMEAEGACRNDNVVFTEEIWSLVYRNISTYFPDQEIVGWYLGGPGFLLEAEEKLKKIQIDHFGGAEKLLLKMDSIEKEEGFFTYRDGLLYEFPGYYIYYEKNVGMQKYLMSRGPVPISEEEEMPESAGRMAPANAIRGKNEKYGTYRSLYRLIYASGGMLACIAVLVISGLLIQLKEREVLRGLLNNPSYEDAVQTNAGAATGTPKPDPLPTKALETVPTALPATVTPVPPEPSKAVPPEVTKVPENQTPAEQKEYIVQKGDTLASICMSHYGTVEFLQEVMKLNGLEDRNKIYAGQLLYLP